MKISLKIQTILAFLIIGILPMITVGMITSDAYHDMTIEHVDDQMQLLAEGIADQIEDNMLFNNVSEPDEHIARVIQFYSGGDTKAETFIVDENGNIVVPSTRMRGSLKRVNTKGVKLCINDMDKYATGKKIIEHEEQLVSYENHFGEKVFGNHGHVQSKRWCIITEVNEEEVLGPVLTIKSKVLILAIIILCCITAVAIGFSWIILKPLKRIEKTINDITKGNLGLKLQNTPLIEYQHLIDSLNRILASLKLAVLKVGVKKSELGLGKAIKAKEEAEARFKAIYESSADAIMMLDKKGFFDCNQATLDMFKVKSVDAFKKFHPADLSPPKQPDGTDSYKASMKQIKTAYEKGTNHFSWVHKRTDGTTFDADVLLSRVKIEDRVVLQATVRDVSAEKKIQEEIKKAKEKYDELIRNIPDVIYSALPVRYGQVRFITPKWKEWTGYSPEDFKKIKDAWIRSIHPEDRKMAADKYMAAIKAKKPFEYEYRVVHKKTGKVRHLRDKGVPIVKDGKVIRIDGMVTDITAIKDAEAAIRKKTTQLERFARVVVGREKIMIQLKKKIKKLEKQLIKRGKQ